MTDARTDLDARRASFLSKADEYERYRPGYPAEAVRWLVGSPTQRVLDLGCGPGKLTAQISEVGHDVVGVDPSLAMLQGARRKGLLVVRATAERLPFRDSSVDVVTAATAFHWFDVERAVPEMRRLLPSGGKVGLVTNMRDESVPWVKALSEIIGSEAAMAVTLGGAEGMEAEFVTKLEGGGLFTDTERRVFDYQQELTAEGLLGLVRSRSYIAILPDKEREERLAQVATLCREHPDLQARETFVMPYKTYGFRALAQ